MIEAAAPAYERYDCTGPADSEALVEAAEAARAAIARGECVVLPTDTVYGIGADAFDPAAVQRLLDAKGRGRDMPPPVLIADARLLRTLAVDIPADARVLVAAFWPGPLTVICRAQPSLRMDLGDTEGTVALRVPDHPLARELLRRTGPLAVSSANLSGKPAALSCDEAVAMLADKVAVYLDGGILGSTDTAPSTIVDFASTEHGRVLRLGALSLDELREHVPELAGLPALPVPPASVPARPAPAASAGAAGELPPRLRHTLQPPPPQTPVGAELAAEHLGSPEEVRAAIQTEAGLPAGATTTAGVRRT